MLPHLFVALHHPASGPSAARRFSSLSKLLSSLPARLSPEHTSCLATPPHIAPSPVFSSPPLSLSLSASYSLYSDPARAPCTSVPAPARPKPDSSVLRCCPSRSARIATEPSLCPIRASVICAEDCDCAHGPSSSPTRQRQRCGTPRGDSPSPLASGAPCAWPPTPPMPLRQRSPPRPRGTCRARLMRTPRAGPR